MSDRRTRATRALQDGRPHLPLTTPHAPSWKDRRWASRVLHRMDETGSHPTSGLVAIATVAVWGVVGAVERFPEWWATILFGVTGAVTFVMVFVIQHTQARQTAATQLKLDELIRATIRADDGLIAVQEAPEGLLDRLTESAVTGREWD